MDNRTRETALHGREAVEEMSKSVELGAGNLVGICTFFPVFYKLVVVKLFFFLRAVLVLTQFSI
jgi:hypothetical protein